MLLEYDLQFFAKDGPGGEKTEQPTTKKLEDARKEGQVAKSKEIGNAAGILAMFLLIKIYLGTLGTDFIALFSGMYNQIPDVIKMINGDVPFSSTLMLSGQMPPRYSLPAVRSITAAQIPDARAHSSSGLIFVILSPGTLSGSNLTVEAMTDVLLLIVYTFT